jgi:hypothetical protein
MAQKNSTIRYSLKENKLPVPNAPAYVAQVHGYKTITQEQLINVMANANTTVSRQDIIVVLDLLESAVKEQLLNGNRIVTNLFKARVSIKGGFESAEEDFDRANNKVQVSLSSARSLQKYVDHEAATEKVRGKVRLPEVDRVYDFTTNAVNSTLSAGRMAELKGCNLYLNGTDPELGIYFTGEETGEEVKVDVINRQTSGTVLFTVPEGLPAGNYKVTVRCAFGADVREGSLKDIISVN